MNLEYSEPWVKSIRLRLNIQHEEVSQLLELVKENAILKRNEFIIPIFSLPNVLYQIHKMHKMGVCAVLDSIGFIPVLRNFLLKRIVTEYNSLIENIKNIYKFSSHTFLLQEEIYIIRDDLGEEFTDRCNCFTCYHTETPFLEFTQLGTRGLLNPPPLFPPNVHMDMELVLDLDLDQDHSNESDYDSGLEDELDELEDVPVCISFESYNEKIQCFLNSTIENGSCSICLEQFKTYTEPLQWDNIIVKTPCNHWFHDHCLRKQLCNIGPPKCPNCRADVRGEEDET